MDWPKVTSHDALIFCPPQEGLGTRLHHTRKKVGKSKMKRVIVLRELKAERCQLAYWNML